jgi:two-component SAPR family response regulator
MTWKGRNMINIIFLCTVIDINFRRIKWVGLIAQRRDMRSTRKVVFISSRD